jgi:uncharacterized protein YqjF (DUF2071 family)
MSTTTDPIDRIAPTRRPVGQSVVMYQNWRSLTFLHWALPPESLRSLLPAGLGLEVDTFEGNAYVGLVPFTMCDVRPSRLPAVPWLSYFHETNVRSYVHVGGRDPGVWFFSLEAANPIAVALARHWFCLPYFHARMALTRERLPNAERTPITDRVVYRSSRRGAGPNPPSSHVACRVPTAPTRAAQVGTLEHFLIERYLLYTNGRNRLFIGQVHHSPYPVQSAEVDVCDETLLDASGIVRPIDRPFAHFSEGVDVEIFPLRPYDSTPPQRGQGPA